MRSFLAYIAEQYGRKKEDVATDALAYLFKRHGDSRTAFQSFVAVECGYALPKKWSVRSRTKGPNGVPDLRITDDANEDCCAIVENKFRAGLTENQPVGYFKELGVDDGLILFVVPADRASKLWTDLESRCKVAGKAIERLRGFRFSGQSAKHRLCIVSWDQLIRHLKASLDNEITRQTEALMFIDQLQRVCEVADKEKFDNLTPDQIDGVGASTLIRHLTWITRELIGKCINQGIVTGTKKRDILAKVDISESSLYVGQNLLLDGIDIWIGFWPKAWEEYGVSPLWIVFYLPEFGDNPVVEQLQREHRDGAFLKQLFFCEDESGWLIPIPIEPNKSQDDVVDEAFQFVSYLRLVVGIAKGGSSAQGL
jgi:hypothetical protein